MLRILVTISLAAGAACDVGAIPGAGGGDGGMVDQSSNNNAVCVDTVTTGIETAHVHATGATTNAGQPCMNAGCHGPPSPLGPAFTFAGTVYTTSAGTAPKTGATIKVIFGSTTVSAVSDTAGNFWSTQTVMFPSKTLGTACPTLAPMAASLIQGQGNCNTCHSTASTATTLPIYVQ